MKEIKKCSKCNKAKDINVNNALCEACLIINRNYRKKNKELLK